MKKNTFVGIIFGSAIFIQTSVLFGQNVVPNPSFEDTVICPTGHSQMYAISWSQPTAGSCDYFNSCNNGQVGVPQNLDGWQNAKSGVAYAGVFTYIKGIANYREYVQAKLTDTLVAGSRYYVSFYVSLADVSAYACNNFGAYLSAAAISSGNNAPFPYTPQVLNTLSNPLTSKIGWTQIADTIIASGSELYITIGSFDDDGSSDTVFVTGATVNNYAYYYIDDVSVYTNDSLNSLGINNNSHKAAFKVYPNPSRAEFSISANDHIDQKYKVQIKNFLGQQILEHSFQGTTKIIPTAFPRGMYFIELYNTVGELCHTEKVVIQ